jgi:hypothetical protein
MQTVMAICAIVWGVGAIVKGSGKLSKVIAGWFKK